MSFSSSSISPSFRTDSDVFLSSSCFLFNLDYHRVTCMKCDYPWCFICCAPWHEGITCKSYRKGDLALYEWARKTSQGQINAQKCPKCRILISKSSGCDHMHCLKCKTDFCYRCGEKLRRLKFFGDHYSKLSIFGCKYRYKASQPVQRKLIRGAVFGTKLFIAPIIGSVALFTGIAIIGIGITALPVYGGVQLYRKIHSINLLDKKDVNNNGRSGNNRYSMINSALGQNKGSVSTAAQTITISFIDDNYVDEFYHEGTLRVTWFPPRARFFGSTPFLKVSSCNLTLFSHYYFNLYLNMMVLHLLLASQSQFVYNGALPTSNQYQSQCFFSSSSLALTLSLMFNINCDKWLYKVNDKSLGEHDC